MEAAQAAMLEALQVICARADGIDDKEIRERVLSTMVGVGVAVMREAAVRLHVDPHLVEVVASVELAGHASRESGEHLRREAAIKALLRRAEGQSPS